jgi:uncharacterized protein (TIGR02145 family)
MGDFKFNNTTPGSGDIRLGGLPVDEIFHGTEKVWPAIASNVVTICGLEWQRVNTSIVNKTGGGTIPIFDNANDLYQAKQNQEPAACYWQLDENNSEYGLLYNYYAKNAIEPPSGYRLPTSLDFSTLSSFNCIGSTSQNRNRYGANPGNWNMTQLTNTDELGDSGFDSQGYGWAFVNGPSVTWQSHGLRDGYWIDENPGTSIVARGFWISPFTNQLGNMSYGVNLSNITELFFIRFVKDA